MIINVATPDGSSNQIDTTDTSQLRPFKIHHRVHVMHTNYKAPAAQSSIRIPLPKTSSGTEAVTDISSQNDVRWLLLVHIGSVHP